MTASQPEGGETKRLGRPPMSPEDRQEAFGRFIDRVEAGDSLRQALKDSGTSWGNVCRWIANEGNVTADGESFRSRYARARGEAAAVYADRAITVVEDAPANKVEMMRARLLQDGYKWRASVADPKGYGASPNKVEVNVNLGSLHLDALRKVSAKATIAHDVTEAKVIPDNDIARITSGPIEGE